MKLILLFINILICSSILLEQVRKEVIDIALLNLPKREDTNFLKMCKEMVKAKIRYSLNKAESAYFVYKWISQNIEYNCNYILDEDIPLEIYLTYKDGKGGAIGISGLFKSLCEFLNVESEIIPGLTKIRTYNKTHLIDIKDYAWNSISIGRKNYLIDVIKGSGSCSRKTFYKRQNDKFFGINPKDSIRYHFPNDKRWQLLDKIITKDEFSDLALIDEGFFNYFKDISPDVQTLRNENDIKLIMTFDTPIDKIEIFGSMDNLNYEENELPMMYFLDDPKISEKTCEIPIPVMGSGYLGISVKVNNKESFGITYEAY